MIRIMFIILYYKYSLDYHNLLFLDFVFIMNPKIDLFSELCFKRWYWWVKV